MATADDGTVRRMFEDLEKSDVTPGDIARWCNQAPSVVSEWKSGARTFPLWAAKKIAIRLGSAVPIVGEIVEAAGQEIRPRGESLGDLAASVQRMTVALGGLIAACAHPLDWAHLGPALDSAVAAIEVVRSHRPRSAQIPLLD